MSLEPGQRLKLAVITTHPIQYQVPLWRLLATDPALEVRVYFGADFSVRGYIDREFGVQLAWDAPLTAGYAYEFLTIDASVNDASQIRLHHTEMRMRLQQAAPHAALICGYAPFQFYLPLIWQLRRLHIPILLRGEVTDEAISRRWPKRFVRAVVLRWFYRQCRALLAIGENARRHYRARGVPDSKIFWSPYNVDTAWFEQQALRWLPEREAVRRALGFTADQPVLLFCGKLVPRKDPLLVPAALRLLADQSDRSIGLIVVGDGELRDALQVACAPLTAVTTAFVGFQNLRDIGQYYAATDGLILPSRWGETWGLVVNEALQFGKPVLVSDQVGCWRDLVIDGKTGFVFPVGNADALAQRLQQWLALLDGSADTLSAACRRQVAAYSSECAVAGIRAAALSVV